MLIGKWTPVDAESPRYSGMMEPLEGLFSRLEEIDAWVSTLLPLPSLETNDAYMTTAVELMNHCHVVFYVAVSLAPDEVTAEKGYSRRRAIAIGHLVRLMKLYDALRYHTAERQSEICDIFSRLIVETVTKMEYLMQARPGTFKNFVLVAYRPERDMLNDLEQQAASRELLPIESRMRSSVKHHLKEDGLSIKQLQATKNWDLDGKNFRRMLSALERERDYAYGFGIGSHWVHGDWFDLKTHHLRRVGRRYKPKLEYSVPDPRGACPVTLFCLDCLRRFLKWNRSDRDKVLLPAIQSLMQVAQALDSAHEHDLQQA